MTEDTGGTMTLTDFLLARIAEDEFAADTPLTLQSWTGRRVLAECDAKRRIVELHQPVEFGAGTRHPDAYMPDRPICQTCGSGEPYEYPVDWPCGTLKLLALTYADHPGFRDEWRP